MKEASGAGPANPSRLLRGHRFAGLDAVPVDALVREPPLPAEEMTAPEFNQSTVGICRAAGFTATVHQGTAGEGGVR